MGAAAFLLALGVAPQVAASREEQVLELLRTLEQEEGSWRYRQATFGVQAREGERPQLVPWWPVFCGNGIQGHRRRPVPATRPRRAPDLRSRARGGRSLPRSERPRAPRRVRRRAADRVRAARALGFTPALAFVAGLVRFLNDVTDGEDVELGGLLFETEASWIWELWPAPGMRFESGPDGRELVVEQLGILMVSCAGAADFGLSHVQALPTTRPAPLPPSTSGAPSVVVLKSLRAPENGESLPEFRVRYRQHLGAQELVHESRSLVAFLPAAFDLAQRFEVELELAPGRYPFYGVSARVGAAARAPGR